MKGAIFLCLAIAVSAIPISDVNKQSSLKDEFSTVQNLISTEAHSDKFSNFMPLVKQVLVHQGIVVPSIKKYHLKKTADTSLVQTGKDSEPTMADLEKYLPTAHDMLDAMIAVGNVMGGSSGYNPITMVSNAVGGNKEMEKVVDDMMRFPFRFPEITENQIFAAENVLMSAGLGFVSQEQAVDQFIRVLTPEQKKLVDDFEKNVFEKLYNSMTTADGKPAPALVEEIKSQMREMEKRTGSTDRMPDELKDLLKESSKANSASSSFEELAHIQSAAAVQSKSAELRNLMPLVKQSVIYSSVVLPSAKKFNSKKGFDMILMQTDQASSEPSLAPLEKYLATPKDSLDAMIAIGKVMGGSSGFNPIQMVTNVVGGNAEMEKIVDEIMKFPFRFPDITENQMVAAENVMMSVGLGFVPQEKAIDQFMDVLTKEQRDMVEHLEKNVFEKLLNALNTPDGEPTRALVEEIKSQMRDMEKKTGSTEQMPEELKELVSKPTSK